MKIVPVLLSAIMAAVSVLARTAEDGSLDSVYAEAGKAEAEHGKYSEESSTLALNLDDEPLLNTSSGLDDILMIENGFYRNLYYWDDTKIKGKSYTVRLNTNYEADYEDDFITPDGTEHIKRQVKYRISLYSLSEEFYRYLKSLNDQKNNGLGNSELAPIRSTYTNVINGIGVVGGCRMFQTEWIDNLQEN